MSQSCPDKTQEVSQRPGRVRQGFPLEKRRLRLLLFSRPLQLLRDDNSTDFHNFDRDADHTGASDCPIPGSGSSNTRIKERDEPGCVKGETL